MICDEEQGLPQSTEDSEARKDLSRLQRSVIKGDTEGVKKWLTLHPRDGDLADENGWTALHFAAANDANGNVMDILIKANVSINKVTDNHWSALHLAAYNNNSIAVEQLLRSGADAAIIDDGGNTAGQMAELCDQQVMASHLHHFFLQKKKNETTQQSEVTTTKHHKRLDESTQRRKLEIRKRREDRDRYREQERLRRLRLSLYCSEIVQREDIERSYQSEMLLLTFDSLKTIFNTVFQSISLSRAEVAHPSFPTPKSSSSRKSSKIFGNPSKLKKRKRHDKITSKGKELKLKKQSIAVAVPEEQVETEVIQEQEAEAIRRKSQCEIERRHKREQWVEQSEVTHTGEYIRNSDDHYRWTCCRTSVEYGEGCVIAFDRTKPMWHFGEYRFHTGECSCGIFFKKGTTPRRRSRVSFTQPEVLTPRNLHSLRLHGSSSYCIPNSGCYDCCGEEDRDSMGCYYQKVYLPTTQLAELFQPTAMEEQLNKINSLRISNDLTAFECSMSPTSDVFTIVCNPGITTNLSRSSTSFQFEVTVDGMSQCSRDFLNVGIVDEDWLSLPENCKIQGTSGIYSSFLGGYHSLGWWSNSGLISGMGRRERTQIDPSTGCAVRYRSGDSVTVLIDMANKEVVFFANRVLAAIIRLPAVLSNSVVFPAVSLHPGSKISFRPSVKSAPFALRPVAREKEKWLSEWQANRYQNEKQERDELIAEMRRSDQLIE